MVSSKPKRRSWTGYSFSSSHKERWTSIVLCISENTQDEARKCEVEGRLGSSEQEAGGDVWGFAEADSESGKEPWQAGGWEAAQNSIWEWGVQCVSRPASWMRAWTLWSPRFGSFGSESSQVAEIFDVISSSPDQIYSDQHFFQAAITSQALREQKRAQRRQRAQ